MFQKLKKHHLLISIFLTKYFCKYNGDLSKMQFFLKKVIFKKVPTINSWNIIEYDVTFWDKLQEVSLRKLIKCTKKTKYNITTIKKYLKQKKVSMKYYLIMLTSFKNETILSSSMSEPFSKWSLHVNVLSKKFMYPFGNLLKTLFQLPQQAIVNLVMNGEGQVLHKTYVSHL